MIHIEVPPKTPKNHAKNSQLKFKLAAPRSQLHLQSRTSVCFHILTKGGVRKSGKTCPSQSLRTLITHAKALFFSWGRQASGSRLSVVSRACMWPCNRSKPLCRFGTLQYCCIRQKTAPPHFVSNQTPPPPPPPLPPPGHAKIEESRQGGRWRQSSPHQQHGCRYGNGRTSPTETPEFQLRSSGRGCIQRPNVALSRIDLAENQRPQTQL